MGRPGRLPVTEAATRLEAMGQPFLFFVNAATGRGNVIYPATTATTG